jgi:hypothetical protein
VGCSGALGNASVMRAWSMPTYGTLLSPNRNTRGRHGCCVPWSAAFASATRMSVLSSTPPSMAVASLSMIECARHSRLRKIDASFYAPMSDLRGQCRRARAMIYLHWHAAVLHESYSDSIPLLAITQPLERIVIGRSALSDRCLGAHSVQWAVRVALIRSPYGLTQRLFTSHLLVE